MNKGASGRSSSETHSTTAAGTTSRSPSTSAVGDAGAAAFLAKFRFGGSGASCASGADSSAAASATVSATGSEPARFSNGTPMPLRRKRKLCRQKSASAESPQPKTFRALAAAASCSSRQSTQGRGERQRLEDGRFAVTSFEPVVCADPPPHTLLLGSVPSVSSHAHQQYYGFRNNAFWWLIGDALGFRRGGPALTRSKGEEEEVQCESQGVHEVAEATSAPYAQVDQQHPWPFQWGMRKDGKTPLAIRKDIVEHIHHPNAPVFSYDEQVRSLTAAGYALWDIMGRCNIKNSDDTSIRGAHFNDVPKLLEQFPTIDRIVFCSGATTARHFLRHHGAWLAVFRKVDVRVALARGPQASAKADLQFRKLLAAQAKKRRAPAGCERPPLTLCLPESVSPAVAHVDYPTKRETWFQVVFDREPAGSPESCS